MTEKSHSVASLHQIEITSRCNLRCQYCVHRDMAREKEDMTEQTFIACLTAAAKFVHMGTQHELNLAGIGESTLHPKFAEWVFLAREAVGPNCHIVLSSNGVGMTQEQVNAMQACNVSVYVSPHRPEKAAASINMLRKAGILRGLSEGAWTGSVDWAGQIDWPVTAPTEGAPCPWLPNGRVTAFSDGRLSTCCFDSDGRGVVGTIDELLAGKELHVSPYSLCSDCHHTVKNSQSVKEQKCT